MAAPAPWDVIVSGNVNESQKLAIIDLQRYFAQASGVCPTVETPGHWERKPRPAVVIGSPQSNSIIADLQLGDQINHYRTTVFSWLVVISHQD